MRLLKSNVGWRKLRRMLRIAVSYAKSYIFFQGWRSYVWYEGYSPALAAFRGPRRGHKQFCADPFLFRHGGETYLFYETVDQNEKGYIGCLKETPTLHSNSRWTDLGPVLKEPWHLSYPQVFEEEGKVYMLPESCDFGKGGVYLYEAESFPTKWRRVATLIDRPFADATILKHEGHWYMACYTIPPHESAELWHAPTLLGPWTRHPCWDKINKSKRLRRCGGSFIHSPTPTRNSNSPQLYRVAQDCNGPLYGKRLFQVEVTKISPTEYEEGAATLLHDRFMPPYGYCHTYNEISWSDELESESGKIQHRLCVVDVHHNVLKWPHQIVMDILKAVRKKLAV